MKIKINEKFIKLLYPSDIKVQCMSSVIHLLQEKESSVQFVRTHKQIFTPLALLICTACTFYCIESHYLLRNQHEIDLRKNFYLRKNLEDSVLLENIVCNTLF